MSKINKIMTFIVELWLAMQSKINYHMLNKLKNTIKIVINFDNAYFHRITTALKNIARLLPKREYILYIPRLKTLSSDTTKLINLDVINWKKNILLRN